MTPEEMARKILRDLGYDDYQTCGNLIFLANLICGAERLCAALQKDQNRTGNLQETLNARAALYATLLAIRELP